MRLVSDIFREMTRASSSAIIPVALLTFEHPSWPDVRRYCSISEALVSNGETFVPQVFDLELPDQPEGRGARASLQMMGVTLEVEERLLSVRSSPMVTIEIVLRNTPNLVEIAFPAMVIQSCTVNQVSLDMNLVSERVGSSGATMHDFTPRLFPGLF